MQRGGAFHHVENLHALSELIEPVIGQRFGQFFRVDFRLLCGGFAGIVKLFTRLYDLPYGADSTILLRYVDWIS